MTFSHQRLPSDRHGAMLWDALLGVVLIFAVAVVFVFDRRQDESSGESPSTTASITETQVAPPKRPPLRIAIFPEEPIYDDMGKLLRELGDAYQFDPLPLDSIRTSDVLANYEVVFLTCSGLPEEWLGRRTGEVRGKPGFEMDEAAFKTVTDKLRAFVKNGGTLYASDHHFGLVAMAFPEYRDEEAVDRGAIQSLDAEVVDEGLRDEIGASLSLRFDLSTWYPAAFRGKGVTVLLRSPYKNMDGVTRTAPLLIKFKSGSGTVVFTSFHNEKQNSKVETKLLRYLVFTALTAHISDQLTSTMIRGGFSPTKSNLFSASVEAQTIARTYQLAASATLRFDLGFQEGAARFKLRVVGPDGVPHEKEDSKAISIEVPGAAAGEWRYEVTALEVPNENFPMTLNIGTK